MSMQMAQQVVAAEAAITELHNLTATFGPLMLVSSVRATRDDGRVS